MFRQLVSTIALFSCGMAAARADVSPMNYQYLMTLPTLETGIPDYTQPFQYKFSFVGPLTAENPSGWLYCPLYCGPVGTPGTPMIHISDNPYTDWNTVIIGSSGSDAVLAVQYGGWNCFEVPQCSFNVITFTFTEPDSFWSTLGEHIVDNAVISWNNGTATETFACTECAVFTATPEPGLLMPLGVLFAGLFTSIFRRRRR